MNHLWRIYLNLRVILCSLSLHSSSMKTINGVLIFWSEIKIGKGGCRLFAVVLGGRRGAGNGHRSQVTSRQTDGELAGLFFNQR